MSEVYYRQCILKRGSEGQTAWIPEKFSKGGAYLQISGEDGWRVERVGEIRREGSYLAEHERNHLTQRQASDI
jgi:hypothetical protein